MERLAEEIARRLVLAGFVEVETSARHVHLSRKTMDLLFGGGSSLHPDRPLSQPGQFLAKERVCLYGPKGRMEHVAVLGPLREYDQVELSESDCRRLGLSGIPVRESGMLKESGSIVIEAEAGETRLEQGVIIAQRHIHAPIWLAERLGIWDGQRLCVRVMADRPAVLEEVLVRVGEKSRFRMHIDQDEANALGASGFTLGRLLLPQEKESVGYVGEEHPDGRGLYRGNR